MKTWHVIDALVAAAALEAVEYGLMEAGAIGTEAIDHDVGQVTVAAYFERFHPRESVRANILEALRLYGFDASALIELQARELEDQDWLAEWKKHWRPVEVGHFIIAPPWLSEAAAIAGGPGDRKIIRIDPGMAFGTGTHETTRLCLKAIEKYYAGGSFLDVGAGTGILAIAAVKLAQKLGRDGAITAYDVDAEAISIARQNAQINQVAEQIDFCVGTIDEETPSANVVCANLTAPVIVEMLPALLSVSCGRLILSGILETQFEMVNARLVEQAATVNEIMQDNEWLALVI